MSQLPPTSPPTRYLVVVDKAYYPEVKEFDDATKAYVSYLRNKKLYAGDDWQDVTVYLARVEESERVSTDVGG